MPDHEQAPTGPQDPESVTTEGPPSSNTRSSTRASAAGTGPKVMADDPAIAPAVTSQNVGGSSTLIEYKRDFC